MSEQAPRSNPRLDNFDANKRARAQAAFEDSLYDNAGTEDFSDRSRKRVEEADAYERHLETLANRPEAGNLDHLDDATSRAAYSESQGEAIEMNQAFDAERAAAAAAADAELQATMEGDVRIRQMVGIAASIAQVGATKVTPENDARMSEVLKAKQDRLEELLVDFSENSGLGTEKTEEITNRIIDMTEVDATAVADAEIAVEAAQSEPESNYEEAGQPGPKASPEAEGTAEEASEAQSVDGMIDAAKIRLDARAEEMEAEAAQKRNGTEQAKVDRDLIGQVDVGDIEPVDEEQPADDDEKIGSVDVSDIESVDGEQEDVAVEDERSTLRRRWDRLKYLATPLGFADEMRYRRGQRAEANASTSEKANDENERDARSRRVLVIGGAAVLAAGLAGAYLMKYGVDSGPKGGSGGNGGNWLNDIFGNINDQVKDVAEQAKDAAETKQSGGGAGVNWADFSPKARNVTNGEGWYETFQQMGIPQTNWGDVLQNAGPKLGKLGEAYFDNGTNEWRISRTGALSNEALRAITGAARRDGVNL